MRIKTSSRHALAALAAILAIAAFAGCGSKSGNNNTGGASSGTTATSGATQASGSGTTGASGSSGASGHSGKQGSGTSSGKSSGGATGGTSGGAAGTKPAPADTKGTEPPPIQLLAGELSGIIVSKPTVIVVHSEKKWEALQKRIFSHGVKPRPVSGTDFSTRQIIGLFMPKQPPGTLMSITRISQKNGKLIVTAAKIKPGKNCKRPAYKTNPFHLVDTRQMVGRPEVVLETVASSPC